jgi:membrane-associated phospholipid phosphatase
LVEIGWIIYLGNAGRGKDDAYATETGRLAAYSYMITSAASLAMKYAIRRERPKRHYQPRLWNTRITPSFPSGHTASSAATATMAALRNPQYAGVAFLYATVSAYSQVYTGNHYLGDVLAGAVVGYLASRLILRTDRDRDPLAPTGKNVILPALRLELTF